MTRNAIDLPIKRLDPTVELPAYAYEGDAGLDLRSNEDVVLAPFERRLIGTGLAIAIPDGYAGFVQPRSGLALKKGLSMANTPGLVDAHYRGELRVCAINLDAHEPIVISKGALPSLSSSASPRCISARSSSLTRRTAAKAALAPAASTDWQMAPVRGPFIGGCDERATNQRLSF